MKLIGLIKTTMSKIDTRLLYQKESGRALADINDTAEGAGIEGYCSSCNETSEVKKVDPQLEHYIEWLEEKVDRLTYTVQTWEAHKHPNQNPGSWHVILVSLPGDGPS